MDASSETATEKVGADLRLILVTLTVNLLNVGYGCLAGYPSPALPNMNQHSNPFHLSTEEQSWVGSLLSLGSAIGGLICGTTCDYFGRKVTMMSSSFLLVVALTLITSATQAIHLYIGFFMAGFISVQTFAASMLYMSEISPAHIRGRMTTTNNLSYALGMLVVYIAGAYLTWNWLAVFVAVFYTLPPLVLAFLPESPRWLLLKGRRLQAVNSFDWFYGPGSEEHVQNEVRIIEDSIVADRDNSITPSWSALLERDNSRPLAMCCCLFAIQAFSGVIVLQIFTVTIFDTAGVNWDPNLQSVVTGLFFFLGSCVCPVVVDRIGRKSLLIASTTVVCASMVITGTFFKVQEHHPDYARRTLFWLPVVGLSLGTFSYASGLLAVPYLLACELFPTRVRGNVQTVTNFFIGLAYFACLKSFTNIQQALDTSGAFFLYALVCAFGILFATIAMKESRRDTMR